MLSLLGMVDVVPWSYAKCSDLMSQEIHILWIMLQILYTKTDHSVNYIPRFALGDR